MPSDRANYAEYEDVLINISQLCNSHDNTMVVIGGDFNTSFAMSTESRTIKLKDYSVWSYVIPWESRVNSCHLRFSCSESYADSKKIGCLFLGHLKVIFRPLEVMTPRSHLFFHLLFQTHVLLVV